MAFGTATVATNAGRAIITNRLIGSGTEPKFVAIGTGATGADRTAVATDTALSTQVETRTDGTSSRVTTTVTNDTYRVIGTVTATSARAVDEAGTFDAASSGNMMVSATFPVVNLLSGDSIQITADVVFA